MRRSMSAGILWLAVTSSSGVSQEPPQSSPPPITFRAQTEMVTIEVAVLDPSGRPTANLRKEDFSVFEDGTLQEIASFQAVDASDKARAGTDATGEPDAEQQSPANQAVSAPFWTYVLLIDDLHLTPPQATDVRKAVSAFLSTAPAGCRIALIATGARMVEDRRLPDGRKALEGRLALIRGSTSIAAGDDLISDHEAYDIQVRHDPVVENIVTRRVVRLDEYVDLANDDPHLERAGLLRAITETRARAAKRYVLMTNRARTTLGVLYNAVQWLAGVKGRRTVILASRGFIRDPAIPEFEAVQRASLRANVAVSFLDARGLRGQTPFESAEYGPSVGVNDLIHTVADGFSEAAGTESVALESGGMIIHYANDLTKGLQKIASASQAYYLLGFQSSNPKRDGAYRKLKVRLNPTRSGHSVLGRPGYYAPRE